MSITMRTSSMSIYPSFYRKDEKTAYYSTDIVETVNYNITFSPDGGNDPKQMKQLFEKCADEGTELDIIFSTKKGRFGTEMVVYDLKPKSQIQTKNAVKP